MQIGDYTVHVIQDAQFRLDGGAMFGVVPRKLWSQVCPPDDENRIRMNMNCVLVDTGAEKVLIETGIGDKWPAKHARMYGIDRAGPLAQTLFMQTGVSADEVSIVVNTHLHFDHAGGNTKLGQQGDAVAAFPNARYFVSRAELDHAEHPTERDRASYLPDNWRPLVDSGQLELKDANYEVVPGLTMETIAGHNRSMQCWRLEREGKTMFGFADLVPTRAHLRLPWIMGYDLYPVETLAAKKRLLPEAAQNDWLCLFYHDADEPVCRVTQGEKEFVPVPYRGEDEELS
ncbi:MAG TPA: MBL fold metallo-hydrolase [Pyrinomonadaceae bacterium]|jgi:glyoxylase-like metal-dependent hydrolase (beta-lactamase superfamily II)|nr:MBL fold metallo-hydrolase [Pyrinomonadaceae bacterium]